MSRQLRAALWLAYVVYLSWVVYLVWTPDPGLPSGAITRVVELATRLGVTVDSTHVEFALNIVMLVPLSLIGGLLFQRLRVTDWTAIGFGASLAIEVVQRLVLPTRSGSSRDIVANTLGSFLGAALLVLTLGILAQHRRSTPAEPSRATADRITP